MYMIKNGGLRIVDKSNKQNFECTKKEILSSVQDRSIFKDDVSILIEPQISEGDTLKATIYIKDTFFIREYFKNKELNFINNSSYFSDEEIKKFFFYLKRDVNKFHYYLFSLFLYKLENRSLMESDIELNINEFCNEFNKLNLGITIEYIDLDKELIKFKEFNLLEI